MITQEYIIDILKQTKISISNINKVIAPPYISLGAISSKNVGYANDEVILEKYYIDIKYIVPHNKLDIGYLNKIKKAMTDNGFKLQNGIITVPSTSVLGAIIFVMEFAKEVSIGGV